VPNVRRWLVRSPLVVLALGSLCGPADPSTPTTAPTSSGPSTAAQALAQLDLLLGPQPATICTDEAEIPPDRGGAFARRVVAHEHHACAHLRSGIVRCWGRNDHGQLGSCDAADSRGLPVATLGGGEARAVAVGIRGTCVLGSSGRVACTDHIRRTLGGEGPGQLPGIENARALAVGDDHVCVLGDGGAIACFGHWTAADTMGPDVLVQDDGTDSGRAAGTLTIPGAVDLVAGSHHTCARDGQGQVSCWGRNAQGQLGDPRSGIDMEDNRGAVRRVPGLHRVDDFAAYGDTTCALDEAGRISCWGQDFGPQAKMLQTPDATDVAVGPGVVCFVTRGAAVGCVGPSAAGLTAGLANHADVEEVAVGRDYLCARRSDGTVRCHGDNRHGQLGDGSIGTGRDRARPVLLDGVPL
jgi:hypothetical protein